LHTKVEIPFCVDSEFIEPFDKFFATFEVIASDFARIDNPSKENSVNNKCKFCGKSYPTVTFKNIAHTIPEFLGNKGSVSNEECDVCNKYFGKLEKQLYNFLGPSLTFWGIPGKKGLRNFASYKRPLQIKKNKLFETYPSVLIDSGSSGNERINFNELEKRFEIEYVTEPYCPRDVYKSLLKMALGLLPKSICKDYSMGFRYLGDRRNKVKFSHDAIKLFHYNLSANHHLIGTLLMANRNKKDYNSPLIFVLFIGSEILQIAIPFNNNHYVNMKEGVNHEYPICPPFLMGRSQVNYTSIDRVIDMNGNKKETRTLSFQIKPSDMNIKPFAIDQNSLEEKDYEFNPKNISSLILMKKDIKIDLSEIKKKKNLE